MSSLKTLKDKDPKEVAKVLSMVSSSLLPHPGIGDVILQTGTNSEFVKNVLSEIRNQLRVREEDNSIKTQSRIYAFLSEEISKAALANTSLSNIESRLGDKGELHPSNYEVEFDNEISKIELLGIKRNHIAEAINHPDKVNHIQSKYLERGFRPSIFVKSITSKRVEDEFILLVVSSRRGKVQQAWDAFRVYKSDVDLSNAYEPIDILKSFVDAYGMRFRLGNSVSKFMYKETISIKPHRIAVADQIEVLDWQHDRRYSRMIVGGDTSLQDKDGNIFAEVLLAYVIDISKYVETLRKHKVYLAPEAEKHFTST